MFHATKTNSHRSTFKIAPLIAGVALMPGLLLAGCAVGGGSDAATQAPGDAASPTSGSEGSSTPLWEELPETPSLPAGGRTGTVASSGQAEIAYTEYGRGDRTVVLLHGGPANMNYLAGAAEAFMEKGGSRVILIDTRGHGRSTIGDLPLSYDLFSEDVSAVLGELGVSSADFVGWSDGGITALNLAMTNPDLVHKVVAFGANVTTEGVYADAGEKPAFAEFLERSEREYASLSETPDGFEELNSRLGEMYATQPNWSDSALGKIQAETLILDGDHDEAIMLDHTRHIADTIPGARLEIIKDTSHFAFLQNPKEFNKIVTSFIAG